MNIRAEMPDYHTHTSRCGHAVGRPEDYVAAALDGGLSGIGISDHMPLAGHPDPALSMTPADLPDYVAEVLEVKRKHPGFVLLGIEADYFPDRAGDVRAVLESQPFDYVIGSVHYLDGWGFDNPENLAGYAERDINAVYARYFELLGDAAATGLYTIIGHLDLVKKFGYRPTSNMAQVLDTLLRRLARAGVIVEINTAGLRAPVAEVYPSPAILAEVHAHGIPITFGSDAHAPQDVGWGFAVAAQLARRAGFRARAELIPQPGGRMQVEYRRI